MTTIVVTGRRPGPTPRGATGRARAIARAALLDLYRPAVAQLLADLEVARASNVAVRELCEAGYHAGLDIPAMA